MIEELLSTITKSLGEMEKVLPKAEALLNNSLAGLPEDIKADAQKIVNKAMKEAYSGSTKNVPGFVEQLIKLNDKL